MLIITMAGKAAFLPALKKPQLLCHLQRQVKKIVIIFHQVYFKICFRAFVPQIFPDSF